jgi:hypothetical protein
MVPLDSIKHCLGIILLFEKWHPIFFLCFPGYLAGTQRVSWKIEKKKYDDGSYVHGLYQKLELGPHLFQ